VLPGGLADRVDGRVDALGQPLTVGERAVRAELLDGAPPFLFAAAGDPHPQARRSAERDDGGGDAAAGPLDEDGRAGRQVAATEQRSVGR
jgi:hypothetical protein